MAESQRIAVKVDEGIASRVKLFFEAKGLFVFETTC